MSLLDNAEVISLTDAASASDALDDELARRLGPAPEPTAAERPRSGGSGGTRAHRRKAAPSAGVAPVSASQLVRPIEGLLGLLTFLLALFFCGFNLEDPLAEVIQMDASEAKGIAEPSANMLARAKWFRNYSDLLIGSGDGIALVYGLGVYACRVGPAVAHRLSERPPREHSRQAAHVPAGPTGGVNNPASNGYASGGPFGLSGAYAVTE